MEILNFVQVDEEDNLDGDSVHFHNLLGEQQFQFC